MLRKAEQPLTEFWNHLGQSRTSTGGPPPPPPLRSSGIRGDWESLVPRSTSKSACRPRWRGAGAQGPGVHRLSLPRLCVCLFQGKGEHKGLPAESASRGSPAWGQLGAGSRPQGLAGSSALGTPRGGGAVGADNDWPMGGGGGGEERVPA